MVSINIAYTAAINGDGKTPTLTQKQVWEGLKRKVRHADEFVPIIVGCEVMKDEVIDEEREKVTRIVHFAAETTGGEEKIVKEVCIQHAPCRVDFEQEDGSTIYNFVSKGSDGELLMTYVFEWLHPDVKKGTPEEKELEARHWKVAQMAVEGSIETIRQLVKDGMID